MAVSSPEKLCRAVWEVVASRGIEGASMRAVAERAGCTTGLITHHFPSRAALLEQARRTMLAQTTERADAAERAADDPRLRLREVLAGALPLDGTRQEEARVWLGFAAAAIADPALLAVQREGNRGWLARITRLLQEAADSTAEAAAGAAVGLVALIEGLGSLAVLDPAVYTAEHLRTILDSAVDDAVARARRTREGAR